MQKKNSYESFKVLKFWDKGLQSEWFLLNHLSSFFLCALGSNILSLDIGHTCKKLLCKKNMFSWIFKAPHFDIFCVYAGKNI